MKQIEKRKADHIQVALEEDISSAHDHWDDIRLIHNSLPEIDMDEIDTSVNLFGKKLSFPLMITAITGGYSIAEKTQSEPGGSMPGPTDRTRGRKPKSCP